MLIAEILRAKGAGVITVVQTETVHAAAKLLREKRFGSLVVVDQHNKLIGIITERDIVRIVADKGATALLLKVEDIMTHEVKTCSPKDMLKEVMQLMTLRRVRHVPVVDNGELVGIISSTDVVKYRLNERASEVNVLRDLTRAKV
ncbi:Inosine-5-monophosphate dehydrogenase [Azospirillaceae bacterium]